MELPQVGENIYNTYVCNLSILAPDDFTTLSIPVNRPTYFPGNVLNFRGGTRMTSEIPFDVQVIQDNDDSEPPEIFYINVSPVRTAIVLTERVAVTICGGIMRI